MIAQRLLHSRQCRRCWAASSVRWCELTDALRIQKDAAEKLGVTQPRVSDLVRGKFTLFSLDALVNMVTAAGMHVEITVQNAP